MFYLISGVNKRERERESFKSPSALHHVSRWRSTDTPPHSTGPMRREALDDKPHPLQGRKG